MSSSTSSSSSSSTSSSSSSQTPNKTVPYGITQPVTELHSTNRYWAKRDVKDEPKYPLSNYSGLW